MPTSSIDSRLMSFGELLMSSNYYSVPHYQRDYSWTDKEIDELWVDLTNTIDENRSEHFIGAIVVNNHQKPNLSLIDGQQRFTTISLLMCVVRDIAQVNNDAELALLISQNYLGSRNLRTRKTDPKLILNNRNNEFYQDHFIDSKSIEELKAKKKELKIKNQEKSNILMIDAYLCLHTKVKERISQAIDFREGLIQIEENIRDKLIAIVISVADEANSYLIFETLNNRGLELSVADLLKNHIFSKAGDNLELVQRLWTEIIQELEGFEITKFIRHYWISSNKNVSEKDLFKVISSKFRNSDDVTDFVKSLQKSSEIYGAFSNPSSPVWDDGRLRTRHYISEIILLETTQCFPMLLAAKECLKEDIFHKVLRMITVFSFRYSTICGLNPNKLELTYSNAAKFIRKNKPKSARQIFEQLKDLYPNDEAFCKAFQKKSIRSNHSIARYILCKINNYSITGKEVVANANPEDVNLEHILPKKPNEEWLRKFKKSTPKQYIYRLGNMTLLDSSVNRKIGNGSFSNKRKEAYEKSKLFITREIAENQSWGPKQIEERQQKMSDKACQIWRLDYL
ncbi:DUF262 domain-containing HNH endonuclease family protein [Leptothoe sp. EHU-05/26/07-4]